MSNPVGRRLFTSESVTEGHPDKFVIKFQTPYWMHFWRMIRMPA